MPVSCRYHAVIKPVSCQYHSVTDCQLGKFPNGSGIKWAQNCAHLRSWAQWAQFLSAIFNFVSAMSAIWAQIALIALIIFMSANERNLSANCAQLRSIALICAHLRSWAQFERNLAVLRCGRKMSAMWAQRAQSLKIALICAHCAHFLAQNERKMSAKWAQMSAMSAKWAQFFMKFKLRSQNLKQNSKKTLRSKNAQFFKIIF